MQSQFLPTLVIVLTSLVGAGITTTLEEQTRFLVAAQALFGAEQPTVLRDQLNFLWVAFGSLLGGYVAVALRNITGMIKIVRCYAVSVATAMALTPYLLVTYLCHQVSAEACFGLGFLAAVAAWLFWEVLGILAERVKRAAKRRGWAGVKEEVVSPQSRE
jgi:hypothetical protein